MNDVFLTAAQLWLIGLSFVVAGLLIWGRTISFRVLALDMVSILLISVLVLFALERPTSHALDAALVLGLLGFLGTMRLARNLAEEERER